MYYNVNIADVSYFGMQFSAIEEIDRQMKIDLR